MDEQLTRIERRLNELQVVLTRNGWGEWGKKVLSDLSAFEKRLENVPNPQTCILMQQEVGKINTQLQRLDERVDDIKEDLAVLRTQLETTVDKADFRELRTEMKARAGLIGILTGAIPAIGILIWNFLKH